MRIVNVMFTHRPHVLKHTSVTKYVCYWICTQFENE